jgi:hypothetical protein
MKDKVRDFLMVFSFLRMCLIFLFFLDLTGTSSLGSFLSDSSYYLG